MAKSPPKDVLSIPCWPQLRNALQSGRMAMLGSTPEEVATFLIIHGLETRMREDAQNVAAADRRFAAVHR